MEIRLRGLKISFKCKPNMTLDKIDGKLKAEVLTSTRASRRGKLSVSVTKRGFALMVYKKL